MGKYAGRHGETFKKTWGNIKQDMGHATRYAETFSKTWGDTQDWGDIQQDMGRHTTRTGETFNKA